MTFNTERLTTLSRPIEQETLLGQKVNFSSIKALLSARRVFAYAGMVLTAEIVVAIYLAVLSHGAGSSAHLPTDFVAFYAAGDLAKEGVPQLAYDPAAEHAAEEQLAGPDAPYDFFFYPPVYLLVCRLLACLPYGVAFVVFQIATLLLLLTAIGPIVAKQEPRALFPLLAFPVVFWNFGFGQNAFLTAALFAGAMALIDRRPIVAGLLFGAVCYKPQLGLLIPVALVAGSHWRAFFSAVISVAGLSAVSLALLGEATWQSFLTSALTAHSAFDAGAIRINSLVSPYGAALILRIGSHWAYGIQAAATLGAALVIAYTWRGSGSITVRGGTLAAMTLVGVPFVHFYDLMLGALAVFWIIEANGESLKTWERLALAVLFLIPAAGVQLTEITRLPLLPASVLALGVIVARVALRDVLAHRGGLWRWSSPSAAEPSA
jgi:alpha-1,2-mannosyltransferase